jgi:hypothetical protein
MDNTTKTSITRRNALSTNMQRPLLDELFSLQGKTIVVTGAWWLPGA